MYLYYTKHIDMYIDMYLYIFILYFILKLAIVLQKLCAWTSVEIWLYVSAMVA